MLKRIWPAVVLVAIICATTNSPSASDRDTSPSPAAGVSRSVLRVACILDKSVSMRSAGIAPASPNDFAPLLGRVENQGGEIGVGLINEDINRALLRLEVPSPPAPPDETTNPLKRALKELPAYRAAFSQWQVEAKQRVAAFRAALAARLAENSTARFSAINLQLRRAQVFLNEPTGKGASVRPVVVILSDGLDTTTIPRVAFGESTRVLVIGSPARPGAFAYLNPFQFENLSAALRNID
jgi:hypothetical protein